LKKKPPGNSRSRRRLCSAGLQASDAFASARD
jgi:hypothetical protein